MVYGKIAGRSPLGAASRTLSSVTLNQSSNGDADVDEGISDVPNPFESVQVPYKEKSPNDQDAFTYREVT